MPDSNDLKSLDSQLKKTLISAESFKKGSSVDVSKSILNIQKTFGSLIGNVRQLVASVVSLEKVVNNNSRKITSLKNISKTQSTRISGENIGAKLPGSSASNVEDSITKIAASVASIAAILAGRQKALDNAAAFDRRKAEQEKRGVAEGNLEKKFEGLKSEAEKVISPVKSILDRIIDFFVTVFLGRVVYKLLEWFGDKKNADKVKAIGRFLGEMWPKLLALYLVFGSALGGFARGLIGLVVKGAVKLAAAAAGMAAKAGIKGAAGAAGFLGGKYGKLLGAGLEVAATVGTTMAVSKGIENFGGGEQKTQGLAGGGYVRPRFPAFSGGGFNFGGMFSGMGNMFGGFVSGEKGVDKVPAMLSDGEFVMSAGAVQKYGVDTLETMNAAGGGTNKPKMISGTTYAAGGGAIGRTATAAKPTTLTAKPLSANAKLAYNTMKLQFPTAKPYHIAGALANFETEAPGLKPNTYQIGGGPGRGIAQWETPGRWDTATKKYGPSIINSLPLQLSYVKHEMDTGNPDSEGRPQLPYGRNTKSTWLNSTNLIDATTNFMKAYEAPGIPHLDRRLANAKRIMTSINNSNTKVGSSKPKPNPQSQNVFQQLGSSVASGVRNLFGQPAQASPMPYEKGGYAPKSARPTSPIASSKSVPRPIIKPLTPPKPRIMYVPASSSQSGGGYGGGASTSVPSFSATAPGGNAKQKTLGVTR
jgi:hypothetical protein